MYYLERKVFRGLDSSWNGWNVVVLGIGQSPV